MQPEGQIKQATQNKPPRAGFRDLLLLLLLVIILPSLAVEFGLHFYWFESRKNAENQANLELSKSMAVGFDDFVGDLAQHEEALGRTVQMLNPARAEQFHQMLSISARGYPALREFLLIDSAGNVMASSGPKGAGISVRQTTYFPRAIASRQVVVTDIFLPQAEQTPVFVVARGIPNEEGRITTVIAGVIDTDRLAEANLSLPSGQGANVVLFDSQGHEAFRYPHHGLTWAQRLAPETGGLLEQAQAQHEVVGTVREADEDEDRFAARVPVSSIGWVAGAGHPRSEVMAPLTRRLMVADGLELGAVAVSIVAALLLSRTMTRSMKKLRGHADAIERGEWPREGGSSKVVELRELEAAFNTMAASREAMESQLRQSLRDQEAAKTRLEQLLSERGRQRDFLKRLLDNAPIGVAVIDPLTARYMVANPTYEAVPRKPGVSMVGRPVGDFAPPKLAAFMKWVMTRVLESRQPFSVREYEADFGPGREHTFWNNDVVPLLDSDGHVSSLLAITHEVTDQVQARRRIEELAAQAQTSRDELGTIINSVTEGVVVLSPEGNILSANPAALKMHGFGDLEHAPTEMNTYLPMFEFRSPDGRLLQWEEMPMARALAGETVLHVEMHGRAPQTGKTWIGSYSAIPIRGEDGRVSRIVVAIHDLTSMKQAEAALRESEERLRLATEVAGVGTWDWRIGDKQVRCSPQCKILFGLPPDATVTADSFLASVDGQDRSRVEDEVRRNVALPHEYATEYRVAWPDGSSHWLQSMARTFYDEQSKPVRNTGVVIDITHRKQVESQLRAANEVLEQRVAIRTSELERRTSQLRALVSELVGVEARERRRLAQVLHDSLQQLLVGARFNIWAIKTDDESLRESLVRVDQLLEESISESRLLTVELSPPVLHETGLVGVLHWLAQWMQEKHGLEVSLQTDEPADPQDLDIRILLFQSVRELLFNVLKHAGVRSARVAMSPQGQKMVRIVVSDDGVGFDPKQRLAETTSEGGFGIFSIRERLEMMGGQMEIDSAPGQGTRVVLLAPVSPVPQGPAKEPSPPKAPPQLHHPVREAVMAKPGAVKVVLADDHDIFRAGLASLLNAETDIEVIAQAHDGAEAVELALELRPDVVVMDVTMPEMDGVEATARIKAQLPDVHVIGLSMHDEMDVAKKMCDAGATTYLTKGGPAASLTAAIRSCAPNIDELLSEAWHGGPC